MNFKKIITLLLAFALTLSLAACGSKGDGKGDGDAQGATAEEIYVMKPSRCGGYIRIHGTTPASEERYEHLSIGCIAMDDGTGTFGVAVAPDVSGDFSQMSR